MNRNRTALRLSRIFGGLAMLGLAACSSPKADVTPAPSGAGGSASSSNAASSAMSGAGGDWTMRDECALGQDTCAENAKCIDTPDYYECECDPGFTGDGETCIDENECALGIHDCSDNATCTNEVGSYSCACDPGFTDTNGKCIAGYTALAVGQNHNCVIREDKTAWCWGYGGNGRLGHDSSVNTSRVVQVVGGDWEKIFAGGNHTCGIKNDQTLWCWGHGSYGQLGLGNTTSYDTPQQTENHADWQKVALGGVHTCGLRAGGQLHCFGRNQYGQVAGSTTTVKEPLHVMPGSLFVEVASGNVHSCAIKDDGTLWCWGRNNDAQLGIGSSSGSFSTPQQVGTDTDWAALTLGNAHSCGLKTSGALFCWGRNSEHQLGTGDTQRKNVPTEIDAGQLYDRIETFWHTTCGLRQSDGALWCWGDGEQGQLRDGMPARTGVPTKLFDHTDWVDIGLGHVHVCGRRANGRVLCWGLSAYGQTGHGESSFYVSPTPVSANPSGSTTVAAGYFAGCATGDEGSLWCWGRNHYGQLGFGDAIPRPTPDKLEGTDWSSVAVGLEHGCGLKTNGGQSTLWCWGRHNYGQLGTGQPTNTDEPKPVTVSMDTDWAKIDTLRSHTCGLKTGGELYCWGYNGYYQAAEGSTSSKLAPTQVMPGSLFTDMSTGSYYTCAVANDGSLWCWGRNKQGELGTGDKKNRNVPTQVGSATDWKQVFSGYEHTCAIKTDDTLWCWGHGGYGQLGQGNKNHQLTPVSIAGSWASVGVDRYATCALKTDGTLWCWGNGGGGRLGLGNTSSPTSPKQIGSATHWTSITIGQDHACATNDKNKLFCWGSGYFGRVGVDSAWNTFERYILEP